MSNIDYTTRSKILIAYQHSDIHALLAVVDEAAYNIRKDEREACAKIADKLDKTKLIGPSIRARAQLDLNLG